MLGADEEGTTVSEGLAAEAIQIAASRITAAQPTATAVIVVFFKSNHLGHSIWKKW